MLSPQLHTVGDISHPVVPLIYGSFKRWILHLAVSLSDRADAMTIFCNLLNVKGTSIGALNILLAMPPNMAQSELLRHIYTIITPCGHAGVINLISLCSTPTMATAMVKANSKRDPWLAIKAVAAATGWNPMIDKVFHRVADFMYPRCIGMDRCELKILYLRGAGITMTSVTKRLKDMEISKHFKRYYEYATRRNLPGRASLLAILSSLEAGLHRWIIPPMTEEEIKGLDRTCVCRYVLDDFKAHPALLQYIYVEALSRNVRSAGNIAAYIEWSKQLDIDGTIRARIRAEVEPIVHHMKEVGLAMIIMSYMD